MQNLMENISFKESKGNNFPKLFLIFLKYIYIYWILDLQNSISTFGFAKIFHQATDKFIFFLKPWTHVP